MTSRLFRATRFGLLMGILCSALLVYAPRMVSIQCGENGAREYSVFGKEAISSPVSSSKCGGEPVEEQLLAEINNQSQVATQQVSEAVFIDESAKSFPVKNYLSKYISTDYLDSRAILAKNFMSIVSFFTLVFFVFAPPKRIRAFSRF